MGGPSRLGGALFSIPASRASVQDGLRSGQRPGSGARSHRGGRPGRFVRSSNNAGGLEGMTTGMPLIVTAAMKPIPTLMTPLATVNLDTLEAEKASGAATPAPFPPAPSSPRAGGVRSGQAYLEVRARQHGNIVRGESVPPAPQDDGALTRLTSTWRSLTARSARRPSRPPRRRARRRGRRPPRRTRS
ncbi:MAG: chorismate synthase [Eggerthellaceae bacterium]